jgi:hypothetical protein
MMSRRSQNELKSETRISGLTSISETGANKIALRSALVAVQKTKQERNDRTRVMYF